jgi:probable rRNA maturation factor
VTSPGIPTDQQFKQWVDAATSKLLRAKNPHHEAGAQLAIRIVDEAEGRRFNRDYRGLDRPTNVLSFPASVIDGLPEGTVPASIGDLLICAPVVARGAIERCCTEIDHWAHLTIHGVLHLYGYDHEQPDEADIMERMEIEILAVLGIPDPYCFDD